MFVYVQCINQVEKEYSVAFNPNHIACVVDMKSSERLIGKCIILTSTGVEYYTNEDYLEVVSRFNSSL